MTIATRPERPEDSPFLERLIYDTIAEQLQAEFWPPQLRDSIIPMQSRLRRDAPFALDPDAPSQIVLLDDRPVGWFVVSRTPDQLRLVEIMIAPGSRKQGIGTALVRQVIEDGTHSGLPVRLSVHSNNIAAFRLYERLGFRPVSGDEVTLEMQYFPDADANPAVNESSPETPAK